MATKGLSYQQMYNTIAKVIREELEPLFEAEEELRKVEGYYGGRYHAQLDKARLQSGTAVRIAIQFARKFKKYGNFDPVEFLDRCSPDKERYPLSELWEEK